MWMDQTAAALLGDSGLFASQVTGSLSYAPFGSISNPAGTYGALLFNSESVYPGTKNEFCDCLNGNITVSDNCNLLETPVSVRERDVVCSYC